MSQLAGKYDKNGQTDAAPAWRMRQFAPRRKHRRGFRSKAAIDRRSSRVRGTPPETALGNSSAIVSEIFTDNSHQAISSGSDLKILCMKGTLGTQWLRFS